MMTKDILKRKNMSMYRLAKQSGVPYTTIQEIVSGKVRVEKCSAETIYKIAKVLDVRMEEIIEPYVSEQSDFETFKNNVRTQIKKLGDFEFIGEVLNKNEIRSYYQKREYPKCYYLLAVIDYLCNENSFPLFTDYDDIRNEKLDQPIYPAEVTSLAAALKDDNILKEAADNALAEFKHFNIMEKDVRL